MTVRYFRSTRSDQSYGVDDSPAPDAFAPGGKERFVGICVNPGDLYAGGRDACIFQQPAVGLEQVDVMPARHGSTVAMASERPDPFNRETGLLEVLGHFFADLKTVRSDTRAYDGAQIPGPAPISLHHNVDSLLRNMHYRPLPTGVNGCDDSFCRVIQQHRHTVGRSNAYGNPLKVSNKGIISIQIFTGQIRPVNDRHPGIMDLTALYHGVRQFRVSPRRKRFRSRPQIVFQQVRIHNAKILFFRGILKPKPHLLSKGSLSCFTKGSSKQVRNIRDRFWNSINN